MTWSNYNLFVGKREVDCCESLDLREDEVDYCESHMRGSAKIKLPHNFVAFHKNLFSCEIPLLFCSWI